MFIFFLDHQHRNNNGIASEPGRELVLTLLKGAAGFGFTIADSVHGQKVKKVLLYYYTIFN